MRNVLVLIVAMLLAGCASSQKVHLQGTQSKKAYLLFGEALKYRNLMEFNKALSTLDKALAKDPQYIDALDLQGNIYMELGQYENARESFVAILKLKPDHLYALSDLSEIYFALQEYDACLRTLNRILPLVGVGDKRVETLFKIERAKFAQNAVNNPVPFEPKNLGTNINTKFEEYFPGLDIQESTLYFTRRDGSLNIYQQNEDLFYSNSDDGSVWSVAKSLGEPVNTRENEGAFSASPDGKFLYFTSCSRQGGVGRCDIWYTTRTGEQWSEPINVGRPVNSASWESQPSISADGVTLYFASDRPGGFGGTDIWYCIKTETGWSNPINLGPEINTSGDEQFPFIHNDGVTLYFASEGLPGMGKADIFLTRKIGNKWSKPMNLGYPINTSENEWNFIVNRKGDVAYFSSTGLKPNYGGMDIYSVDLYEGARPNKTSYVSGIVFDMETNRKLRADLQLYDLETGEQVTTTFSDRVNGSFLLNLPANKDYALEARADGYLFHSEKFSLEKRSLDAPFTLEIGLKPIKTNQTMVLKNVLFEVDKAILKDESKVELAVLVKFLNNNASVNAEIGGHTDNTGSESHNVSLSNNRAKAVYDFLVNKGIDASRLSYKGYGSSVPVATNDTDEGRQLNRRTEVKIVN